MARHPNVATCSPEHHPVEESPDASKGQMEASRWVSGPRGEHRDLHPPSRGVRLPVSPRFPNQPRAPQETHSVGFGFCVASLETKGHRPREVPAGVGSAAGTEGLRRTIGSATRTLKLRLEQGSQPIMEQ